MSPITYLEIDAYCRLTKESLSLFDIAAIKRLDGVAMSAGNVTKSKKG